MNHIIQQIPFNYYILLSTFLFCIGVMGVMFRRNAIIIFMCVELMLNAVNLLLVAFSAYSGDVHYVGEPAKLKTNITGSGNISKI